MLASIPFRGGNAANTVAGAVSGWDLVLRLSREKLRGGLPLERLLADAIHYAHDGIAVTRSQTVTTASKIEGLRDQRGFAAACLVDGALPVTGSRFRDARFAATLAHSGLDDFYRGDLARTIARDLDAAGSPVTAQDLAQHHALWRTPLTLRHSRGSLCNTRPPAQGVVSLLILGMLDRLGIDKVAQAGGAFSSRSDR